MSQYVAAQYPESARPAATAGYSEQSPWAGWIAFAGIMMVLLGSFHAIQGLVALFKDEYFLVAQSGLVVAADFTTWGWVHLTFGLIVVVAGVSLFTGHMWARIVGVLLAMLSAMANLAFLAAYPLWSAIMIMVDVLVIWAITVHGSEVKPS